MGEGTEERIAQPDSWHLSQRSHLVLLLAKLPTHNTRRRFLTFVMWLMRLCGLALAILDLLLQRLSVRHRVGGGSWATYQGSHGAVKSMSVVASELGVGTLEGRVSVGLGLLDTAGVVVSVGRSHRSD
jgi:hypothetical protein